MNPRKFRSGYFGAILAVFAGNSGAQVASLTALIFLARVYTPDDFGLFAIAFSISTMIASIASLRFDVAIPLPKSDLAAKNVQRLATWSNISISLIATLCLFIVSVMFSGNRVISSLSSVLVAIGIAAFLTAQNANIQFWLTRKRRFVELAVNRFIVVIATSLFQIIMAFITGGVTGLFWGYLLGQLLGLIVITWRTPELLKRTPEQAPRKRKLASRYRKMPLLNGPNVLVDSFRDVGINFAIARIAVDNLGVYSVAYRLIMAPVSLISGSIAQVLLHKMTNIEPGTLFQFVRHFIARVMLFSVPIFAGLYIVAPWLVPLMLGRQWADAGYFVQALIPWAFMLSLTSPVSNLVLVAEKQEWGLLFAVFFAVLPIAFLLVSSTGFLQTIVILGWLMALLLAIFLSIMLNMARKFDLQQRIKW